VKWKCFDPNVCRLLKTESVVTPRNAGLSHHFFGTEDGAVQIEKLPSFWENWENNHSGKEKKMPSFHLVFNLILF
jgi:hypothetical protein